MTSDSDAARSVLRQMWSAQGESGAAPDDDAGSTKTCRNMKTVSFDGMAEPGSDLRDAWRERLQREGKLNTSGQSVRDLVLGPQQPG
jgi:hypothetical protein